MYSLRRLRRMDPHSSTPHMLVGAAMTAEMPSRWMVRAMHSSPEEPSQPRTSRTTARPIRSLLKAAASTRSCLSSRRRVELSPIARISAEAATMYATGLALAKDGSGDTFVVGTTGSSNFPTTVGSVQPTINGNSNGFVTKLNSSGSAPLVYSTYLGGGSGDFASAVAVDSSNDAFVTGATQNATFPTTPGAFQTTCGTAANCNGGLSDAFVSVLKPDASGLRLFDLPRGQRADQGLGIAVDSTAMHT